MQSPDAAISFEFIRYNFNIDKLTACFDYSIALKNGDTIDFTEKLILPSVIEQNISDTLMQALLRDLHLALGISYYKLFCPAEFIVHYELTEKQVEFWNMMYSDGLGEFLHRNGLQKADMAKFTASEVPEQELPVLKKTGKLLVGIGGGKDSIVSVELLKKDERDITGFLIETNKENTIARNVMKIAEIPQFIVRRELDEKLISGVDGAYGGHVPVSGLYAFIGNFVSALYGFDYLIVSNEYSSNFGNLDEENDVNHQWSKSTEFESAFQNYTRKFVTPSIKYFSLLRPFYEIRIVKMFAELGGKYFDVFSSCNTNFKIDEENIHGWCGKCPKCAFAFTMLAAFLQREKVEEIFGKNMFNDESLLPLFNDMLGFGEGKPFDCVGVFDEVKAAMYMAGNKYKDTAVIKKFLPKIRDGESLVKKVFKTNKSDTIPANFIFYGMETALVLGYGKEGKVTESYLKSKYPELKVSIADMIDGDDYLKKQDDHDIVIKTPGIQKEKITSHYTTATNIFFAETKNSAAKVIGVTGSKGKSTVSTLIYEFLKEAKISTKLLGNIGNPMLEELQHQSKALVLGDVVYVCELSSYQLDDLQYSPNIAVVTSLLQDHLDYHDGVENYHNAKRNIAKYQISEDIFIYNNDNDILQKWALETNAQPINYLEVEPLSESNLLGKHNEDNIKAAISVVRQFDVTDEVIKKVLKNFKGLKHRLEFVGEFCSIKFYDDAISTTPESTIAAIKALPNTQTIFLGGTDRGYDFAELEGHIKNSNIKNIVLFPDSGRRMFTGNSELNILRTENMQEAVKFAYKNTENGKICLLSPASPSFSLYKNFEERGDLFKKFIKYYYGN